MKLVIVESSEQADKLTHILDKGYVVKASLGQVRRLALRKIVMAVGGEIEERYETICDRELALAAIRKAARDAETVYLATAPDREGELLAWDIVECLPERDQRKARRITLREMTSTGVQDALSGARELDMHLAGAGRARRLLDHLVSRELEPLLAKWGLLGDITRGLSIVEVSALRLVVEREEARRKAALHPGWTIDAQLEHEGVPLWAEMGDAKDINTSEDAYQIVDTLMLPETGWAVERAERHEESTAPPPPFTTLVLLMEAERTLRLSPDQTYRAALELYEAGLITYPFTASSWVSPDSQQAAHDAADKLFGEEYLAVRVEPAAPQSQDARPEEAIRPLDPFHLPDEVSTVEVGEAAARLYGLVWRRFLAAQMKPARYEVMALAIRLTWTGSAEPWEEARTYPHPYTFQARLRAPLYAGFRIITPPDVDDYLPQLPEVEAGDRLNFAQIHSRHVFAPERYSGAALAGALAEQGVGRPRSQAGAAGALIAQGWVKEERGKLIPIPRGEDALYLCLTHFPDAFDPEALAELERRLDWVADARGDRLRATAIFFCEHIGPSVDEARRAAADEPDDEPVSRLRVEGRKETA